MKILPPIRNKNIVVQQLENETLVYDLSINKALCLNETSAKVFEACGGNQTFDDLTQKHNLSPEIIYLALDELKKNNLLESDYTSPFAGMNRREVIRKAGLASMIALPAIVALAAPTATMAASSCTPGGSPTPTPSTQVAVLKAQCCSTCYRDYIPATQTGTCCVNCSDARCQ